MTEQGRMLAGELYNAGDPELLALRDRAQLLLTRFNATSAASADAETRRAVLVELLGAVGPDTHVLPPLRCDYGSNTFVGERTFMNYGTVILDGALVRIGNDVQIATNVQLLTATHPLDADLRQSGVERALPITIEDGVWLGGGVIVCPGVTIGENTVVGAGSVVVRDLPPGVLAVGNPARVVRAI